ncbi:MAG TPA: TIM barrel protein [Bacteroidales bacterium]|nr:TIM barrel protein [Bacteroidales bacterium]
MKTQSRRDFLKLTAAGTLGAIVLSRCAPANSNIALQLYTIRDFMNTKEDVLASLKKLSEIGYKNLELAGYANGMFYGYEPKEFKKIVNDLGMQVLSSHTSVESASQVGDAKKVGDDHAAIGAKYAIQPWVNPPDRTIDFFQKMVEQMNEAGRTMKEVGIKFGYHNHNFEFANMDGKIPYFDIIMPGTDKDLVTMELDLFWTTKAGQDPVEIFKKYPGRFELLHCKDMYTKQDPFFDTVGVNDFAPVGAGVLDFNRIFEAKKTAGAKWFVVEQDLSRDGKPFDDVKTSIDNLSKMV